MWVKKKIPKFGTFLTLYDAILIYVTLQTIQLNPRNNPSSFFFRSFVRSFILHVVLGVCIFAFFLADSNLHKCFIGQ